MLKNLKPKKAEPTDLDLEITRLHEILKGLGPADQDYAATLDQLVKLRKIRVEENSKKRVSPDTMVNAATNLAGILFILNYEHAHVMTSKAVGFVMKSIR